MAGVQNGPLPSHSALLSDLPNFQLGTKVRFLGCVTRYVAKMAQLILEHDYPHGNGMRVAVDINLLLGTLKSNETRIGEWVSVIGYIKPEQSTKSIKGDSRYIDVQALVLWSSGPFSLESYEKSLQQQRVDRNAERDVESHV